jgi:hypothetical protein
MKPSIFVYFDTFAIIESHERAHQMYQALKDRNDSKKTKRLGKGNH